MARKKFEEIEYDPIEAEARRVLARQVSQPTPMAPLSMGSVAIKETAVEDENVGPVRAPVREARFPQSKKTKEDIPFLERKQKKRSFSCANTELDSELDSFLLRIQEAARTHIPFQVLMRAACIAMIKAEDQIISEMKKLPPSAYPATFARVEYAQFEEYWIEVIGKALRKARPTY